MAHPGSSGSPLGTAAGAVDSGPAAPSLSPRTAALSGPGSLLELPDSLHHKTKLCHFHLVGACVKKACRSFHPPHSGTGSALLPVL
mmetsp:Transcript_94849/g.306719  ORF Transcript_94849/g.306719 Transcript_94849/m.306719 type:complete len:86 (-) Transcript_94849:453-710(-)